MADKWQRLSKLLIAIVREGEMTTRRARQITGSTRPQARVDLRTLSEYLDIEHVEDARHSCWRLSDGERRVGIPVSLHDRLAWRVGSEFVEGILCSTAFSESVRKLDRAILNLDPGSDSTDDPLDRRFHFIHEPEKDYSGHRDLLRQLSEALLSSRVIDFEFNDKPRQGIEPLTLLVYKRGLYLLARHPAKKGHRTYRVEKMSALHITSATFKYPTYAEWNPDTLFTDCYGITPDAERGPEEIRLRFYGILEHIQSRAWMPGQRFENGPNGTVDLVFDATGKELVGLALQFGDWAEVISPPWLRDEVAAKLRKALGRYRA